MGDHIKVFFLKPTNRFEQKLRRAIDDCTERCPAVPQPYSYCCGTNTIAVIEADYHPTSGQVEWPRDDERWPEKCEECGKEFGDSDLWLVDYERLYVNSAGMMWTLRDAPVGACWEAPWLAENHDWRGHDGRCLVLRLPNGKGHVDWSPDMRASNCGMPEEKTHKCWVRHGRPEDGNLHIDKEGHTCNAGAGSISLDKWHGFVRNGYLVS